MWRLFDEPARQAVFHADTAVRRQGVALVDTEHLLLGVLEQPKCLGCRLLEALGIEPARLRKEVEGRITGGDTDKDAARTLSPSGKKAIDLAYREALDELGDQHIGTEHLLLGLLREEEGIAAQALAQLGFEGENARLAIAALQLNDSPKDEAQSTTRQKPNTMWQRFTERARKVVFYAQEEAQKFGEGYVSTEHLLLGLVRESDSVAAQVLERLGISLNRVRVEVEKQLPRGDSRPSQDMTLTPRAKRVIDLAFDEARNLNNNYIGTEHLLLGLVREGDGLAGRVLAKLGVDLERARQEVMTLQHQSSVEQGATPTVRPRRFDEDTPALPWSAYDGGAQEAMFRAKGHATGLNETHLSPLHLILALLDDPESDAVRALHKAGVDPEKLREEVQKARTWAEGAPEDIQLSPNGRQAIDGANVEAAFLGSKTLTSGHLLLGLVRGNPSGVGKLMDNLGVRLPQLRDAVQDLQNAPPEPDQG